MEQKANNTIGFLSLPLIAGVAYTSIMGLSTPDFYFRETPNWEAQSLGQDFLDLFLILPVLIISTLLAYRNHRAVLLVWAGTNLYLTYTFCLYAFDVHFNSLFLFYCINLGIAFYSFLYFLHRQIRNPWSLPPHNSKWNTITGIYFLCVAVVFYLLWLMEIIPAMVQNKAPASLVEVGLVTNGVHVIDLSVFLPGLFLVGVLLLRKKFWGFILAPVLLTFMVLMDITIAGLMIVLRNMGLDVNMGVMYAMVLLAIFSGVLLYGNMREITKTMDVVT